MSLIIKVICSFYIFQGVGSLKKLCNDGQTRYTHHDSIDDIYASLSHVVEKEMEADRKDAPFPFFALEADEATDSSNKSILLVYIRYMDSEGDVTSKLLGVLNYQTLQPIQYLRQYGH